ncbi:unnamed protein product [Dovyalis caffra]|uniref:Uncharacterized protein n=1 Tax=Dovyalis caffra TaxID=77055 RepID=A0AAV1QUH2_9ROSI|nr:unnamed protein product [Dovyalis caffra]
MDPKSPNQNSIKVKFVIKPDVRCLNDHSILTVFMDLVSYHTEIMRALYLRDGDGSRDIPGD